MRTGHGPGAAASSPSPRGSTDRRTTAAAGAQLHWVAGATAEQAEQQAAAGAEATRDAWRTLLLLRRLSMREASVRAAECLLCLLLLRRRGVGQLAHWKTPSGVVRTAVELIERTKDRASPYSRPHQPRPRPVLAVGDGVALSPARLRSSLARSLLCLRPPFRDSLRPSTPGRLGNVGNLS